MTMAKVKKIIKKKVSKKKKVAKKKAAKVKAANKRQMLHELSLPDAPKVANFDLQEYTILVYGREKIGKTSFFCSFPDALFLTTEPGTKNLEIFEFNADDGACKNWALIRRAVDLLEKTDRFKNVIFDTVDRAYDMCLDYVCSKRGIEYPGEDAAGKQDWGKSWKAVKGEFIDVVHRILQTGRGLCFTSHATESEISTRSGDKYTRIYPSMSGQARKVIEALVDLFFYAEYVRNSDGETSRVLITEGDETIWAGQRKCPHPIPRFIPILEEEGYSVLNDAFQGEDVGLDPSTFMPGRQTSRTAAKLIQSAKGKAALAKKTKKKVIKKKKKKIR